MLDYEDIYGDVGSDPEDDLRDCDPYETIEGPIYDPYSKDNPHMTPYTDLCKRCWRLVKTSPSVKRMVHSMNLEKGYGEIDGRIIKYVSGYRIMLENIVPRGDVLELRFKETNKEGVTRFTQDVDSREFWNGLDGRVRSTIFEIFQTSGAEVDPEDTYSAMKMMIIDYETVLGIAEKKDDELQGLTWDSRITRG